MMRLPCQVGAPSRPAAAADELFCFCRWYWLAPVARQWCCRLLPHALVTHAQL